MSNKVRTTVLLEKDEMLALTLLAQELQPLGPSFTAALRRTIRGDIDVQRLLPLAAKLINDNPTLDVKEIHERYKRYRELRTTSTEA